MTSSIQLLHWGAPKQIKTMITNRHGGFSQPPFDSLNLGSHVGDDSELVQKIVMLSKHFCLMNQFG